jgi:type II secretory pathway component HofQ
MVSSNLINEGLSAADDPLRQPVNVNFKNMPLDNVVSLLANKGQISVISEVDLAGGVTAQLKDITLGRAIEVILRQENLGIVEEDGIYRITDYVKAVAARRDTRMISLTNANAAEVKATLAEVIASSPDAGLVSLSANATTNMLIVQGPRDTVRDLEDLVAKLDVADAVLPTRTVVIPLNYADPGSVVGLLTVGGMLSGTGKASPDPRTRQIILTDLPQNVDAILELIPTLDLPVKQVSIQAMIVDAIMNDDAETGFDWFLNAVQKGSPPIVGGHLESFGAGFEEPLSTAGSLAFSVLSGDINLDGIIRAEVLSNNAELLAEPVLITTENNPAIINLTSEFPYQEQTQTDAGGQIAATQFKEIGTILNVTPKVTHDQHIGIQIDVKQSVVTGFTTTEVPIEAKRQIVTNLRLDDGETIFIGGLRQHDDRLTVKKVPVLGDIPILNILFRTNSVKKENIELLVFLTCNVMPNDTPELTPYQKEKYDKLGGTPEMPDGTRAVLRPYPHPEEQRDPIWKAQEE